MKEGSEWRDCMVLYIRHNGKLKTFKELAQKYNIPVELVRGRWQNGERDIERLTRPKENGEK